MNEISEKKFVKISDFICDFRRKSNEIKLILVESDIVRYNMLFSGIRLYKNMSNHLNEYIAEDFDIFKILQVNTKEVQTHSSFLSNLLDIKGSHGQGRLFYDIFIDSILHEDRRKNFKPIGEDYFYIKEELGIDDGRMDIYIENIEPSNRFSICIENKIYAEDQPKQLERYYNYMQSTGKRNQILLIYLTITGKPPSEISISAPLLENLEKDKILLKISYKNDITKWLINSMRFVKSEKVKYTIQQYINTIIKI